MAKKKKKKQLTHEEFQALLGTRIKAIREELGYSQETFAAAVGVTQRMISRWERGLTPVQAWHLTSLLKVTKKKASDFLEVQ